MDENYDVKTDPVFENNVHGPSYAYVKRMNFQRANTELSVLSKAIKKEDGDALKNVIGHMPEGMRHSL